MSHRFVSWFCRATLDPIVILGRGFALLLYDFTTFSVVVWACSSAMDVLCCHSGENVRLWAGRVSCIGRGLERVRLCVMGCFSIAVVLGPTCSRLGIVHAMLIG